jgi:hypothetical protein
MGQTFSAVDEMPEAVDLKSRVLESQSEGGASEVNEVVTCASLIDERLAGGWLQNWQRTASRSGHRPPSGAQASRTLRQSDRRRMRGGRRGGDSQLQAKKSARLSRRSADLSMRRLTSAGPSSGRSCQRTAAMEEATAEDTEVPVYIIVGLS